MAWMLFGMFIEFVINKHVFPVWSCYHGLLGTFPCMCFKVDLFAFLGTYLERELPVLMGCLHFVLVTTEKHFPKWTCELKAICFHVIKQQQQKSS